MSTANPDPALFNALGRGLDIKLLTSLVTNKAGDKPALFPGAVGVALAVSPAFAKDHPEAAQRFVNAFLRGLRDYYHAFIKKDVDRGPMVQALIHHTPVKDPALYNQIGLAGVDPNGTLDPKTLGTWDVLQDYFVKTGLQQKKIDLTKYLDQSYLQKAVSLLGKD